jgi:septum formation protein
MIILASNSPRRKEILTKHNINFKIVVSNVDEKIETNKTPYEIAESLAYQKANYVFENNSDDIVLGFDTIVVLNNKIYPKPKDELEEKIFLNELSGKIHEVITGVSIISVKKTLSFHVVSKVEFKTLTEEDINYYISTNEWVDKAGGYAIQGIGNKLVKKYYGDLENIIGLPANALIEALKNNDF